LIFVRIMLDLISRMNLSWGMGLISHSATGTFHILGKFGSPEHVDPDLKSTVTELFGFSLYRGMPNAGSQQRLKRVWPDVPRAIVRNLPQHGSLSGSKASQIPLRTPYHTPLFHKLRIHQDAQIGQLHGVLA
jgi:hypothetical protein